MTRRAAFRQCDVARALKAARTAGIDARVVVRMDGSLAIEPLKTEADFIREAEEERARRGREIVL